MLLRGLFVAFLTIGLRLVQAPLINTWTERSTLFNLALGSISVAAVTGWGVFDGRADAKANPDPDRRRDLAMIWLIAGLVAGVLSGAVVWLLSLTGVEVYTGDLISELSGFAAFTALVVFIPAMAGVAAGRWLIDRDNAKVRADHPGLTVHPLEEQEGEDQERGQHHPDVFAAVDRGGQPTDAVVPSETTAAADPGTEAETVASRAAHPSADAEEAQTGVPGSTEDITTEIPRKEGNPDGESG